MQRAVLLLACVARAAALATGVRGAASPPPRAMIAGGGIGGLFTAITLRNEGYDVSIFEKTREYRSFGGPIQIASNGLEAVPSRRLTRRPPSPAAALTASPATAMGQGASLPPGQRPKPSRPGQRRQPFRSHPSALQRPPQDLRPDPLMGTVHPTRPVVRDLP